MSSEHLKVIEKQVEILKNLEKLLKDGESVTTRSKNQEILVYAEKNLQAFKENDKLLHKLGVIDVPYFKEQWMKGAENYFQKIQNLLKNKDLDSVEQGISEAMLASKIAEIKTVNQQLATGLDLQQKQMNEIMMKTITNHETQIDLTKLRTIMESLKKTIDEAKLEAISRPHTKNIWIGKLKRWNDRLQVELSKMNPIQEEEFREENYIIELEEDLKLLLFKLEENHESIKSDPYANVLTQSPKIELPKFDGKIEEWKIFSDLFIDLVHNKNNVPDSVKLNHLRSCIAGEARTSIASLIQGSSANYNEAWKTLVRRYENKRINFSTQLNYLLDMPMMNATSPSNVKKLHDAAKECIYIITSTIGKHNNENDEIFAHLLLRKFDKEGLQLYEQHIKKPSQIQKLEDVMDFLEQLFQTLESQHQTMTRNKEYKKQSGNSQSDRREWNCDFCMQSGHRIYYCEKFLNTEIPNRLAYVRNKQICSICLKHSAETKCFSQIKCKKCNKSHNTLLHNENYQTKKRVEGNQNKKLSPSDNNNKKEKSLSSLMVKKIESPMVILATAQISATSSNGETCLFRALIDQGSQISMISEEAAQILSLPRKIISTELTGLSDAAVGTSKSRVYLEIRPRFMSNNKMQAEFLVLPTLIKPLPDESFEFNKNEWENYILADPNLNTKDRIDIIIGSDLYPKLIEEGVRKHNGIVAQNTIFGWVVSGSLHEKRQCGKIMSAVTSSMERFWEIEEIEKDNEISESDICMQAFAETTKRDTNGRYVVMLPLRTDIELGESRKQALARFLQFEKKINNKIKIDYIQFMREYENLGHMVKVDKQHENMGKYYLPHHAVVKDTSLTTKTRVVFDASAKTSNGYSLNDAMMIGPRLQNNIFDIIIKWRQWKFVVTADIEKMYRQINIAEEHQDYHRIFWREQPKDKIREYKLTTVTYGTAAAPFLAVRTLQEVANQCKDKDKRIKEIIREEFYVDDLMTGANNEDECRYIIRAVSENLSNAGFQLRKWSSNNQNLLTGIMSNDEQKIINVKEGDTMKTLGLHWDPDQDEFRFVIDSSKLSISKTKRNVLSNIAKIFDPIGWLAPVTIRAKIFIQRLWQSNYDWDDELDEIMKAEWMTFQQNLQEIKLIKIPRWIFNDEAGPIEIHGFADASEKAYAAVIYVKTNMTIKILTAKTKVAPIKNKKTLPKLELCAAQLLARLLNKIKKYFSNDTKYYGWSDSTITLWWIKNNKSKEKFIRSRVADIKSLMDKIEWLHLNSKDNPADVASRGICPSKIAAHELWWTGPQWLKQSKHHWPQQQHLAPSTDLRTMSTLQCKKHFVSNLIERLSNINKIEKSVAYVLRFIRWFRYKQITPGSITVSELSQARILIIKQQQKIQFCNELQKIENKKDIPLSSKIIQMKPYLDDEGILRVGGRLKYARLPLNQKHPIILDKCKLASLIVKEAHAATLHGGNSVMEAYIKRRYYIIGIKTLIRRCCRSCPICIRYNSSGANQIMGDLPKQRTTVSPPFLHVGVDYAGPILMRTSRGRGQKAYKGYIAVFVCMATKAIHLEPVSDLTTEAFRAALRRFFARRGKSAHIYSDNGSNFIGANRCLDQEFKNAIKNNASLASRLAEDKVEWHFIPPASPHFGGLWEAAVKSMKHHLKRIMGESKLTFEEMTTLLCQIEAILNSRPLCAMGNDIDSIDVLSPGHFLVGRPLLDSPESGELEKIGSLDRWKLVQKLKRDFWQKWKDEYLVSLQKRTKWKSEKKNLEEGAIVIIKNENTQPSRWPMGRVVEVHKGSDGNVRVVTLRTKDGLYKRPIHKLCPLETSEEESESKISQQTCQLTRLKEYNGSKNTQVNGIKFLMLMLLVLIAFGRAKSSTTNMSTTPDMTIKNLDENVGIYLDPIGKMDVVASKWRLVVYYDLDSYIEETNNISSYITKLQDKCSKMFYFSEQCSLITANLKRRYEVLSENNKLLIITNRVKRAPLEFVGSLYHILFGIMDSDDRESLEENMKNLLDNQHELDGLNKRQTSLVNATVNVLKKTTDEVNDQFVRINGQINEIRNTTLQAHNAYKAGMIFQLAAMQLDAMLSECNDVQMAVISILIDVNNHHINPLLLKPSQLQEEIHKIRNKILGKFRLPGDGTKNGLKETFRQMKARGFILGRRLVIDAEIPLLHSEASDVFRVIDVPIRQGDIIVTPKIYTEILVFNFQLDAYNLMSQAQLNLCLKNEETHYICHGNWPWKTAADGSCEISPIKKAKTASCHFERVGQQDKWIQLTKPNTWLFKQFTTTAIHISCGNSEHKLVKLPAQGLLTLRPQCTVRYNGGFLTSPQQVKSETISHFEEQTIWTKALDEVAEERIKPIQATIINNKNELLKIQRDLERFKRENIHLKGLDLHHISGHSGFILSCILVIILVIYIVRGIIFRKRILALSVGPQNVQTL